MSKFSLVFPEMRCFTHLVSLQFYGMQTLHKCVCFWLPDENCSQAKTVWWSCIVIPTPTNFTVKHSISRVNTGISRYFTVNVLPILEISLSTKLSIPDQTLLQSHTHNVADSLFGLNIAFLYVEVEHQHWRVGRCCEWIVKSQLLLKVCTYSNCKNIAKTN